MHISTKIKKQFPKILINEPLSNHCTYRIGGPADFFYATKTAEDTRKIIEFAKQSKIPYLVIGGGSNILFDDNGFRGIIIKIDCKSIKIEDEKVTADAGTFVSKLVEESVKNGLTGLEKWVTLPGTVGGAVRGNAGCNGLETKDILEKATILNPKTGKIKTLKNRNLGFKYRTSKIKRSNWIVLSATFKLKKENIPIKKQERIMNEAREFRTKSQPFGLSCGSFFKNPSSKKTAGMLIEKVGLKGKIIGGAQISEKHANFIINTGKASSKDVIKLAILAKKEVQKKFKIELTEEVQIISEKGKITL